MVNIFTQEFMNLLKKILDMSIYIYIYIYIYQAPQTSQSVYGRAGLSKRERWVYHGD
jgi:hypothetical protein